MATSLGNAGGNAPRVGPNFDITMFCYGLQEFLRILICSECMTITILETGQPLRNLIYILVRADKIAIRSGLIICMKMKLALRIFCL